MWLLRLHSFVSLECAKLFRSCRFRGLFLKLFLQPLDFASEWLYLFFHIQSLRLKVAHLKLRRFKLLIEREQLTALLLANDPSASRVGDLPHNSLSEVEAQLPLAVGLD